MKHNGNKLLALLLALVMLTGLFPLAAMAANDEYVLSVIDHLGAVSAVDVSDTHTATLIVPYGHIGALNLAEGLNLQYDTDLYASVSASFPDGSAVSVDGDPVEMTITYQRVEEENLYTAKYSIQVVRADATAPTFSGTVSKTVTAPGSITLTAADFTGLYTQNDGAAAAGFVVEGSNATFGALKWGSANYEFGTFVSLAELNAEILTFTAVTPGTVSYTVKAFTAADEETPVGTAVLTITAQADEDEPGVPAITCSTEINTPVALKASDFSSVCQKVTGESLSYVTFTLPSESQGILYYQYDEEGENESTVTEQTHYDPGEEPCLSNVSFVPASDFIGTVTIAYAAYTTQDSEYGGTIVISVLAASEETDEDSHFGDVGRAHRWAWGAIDDLWERGIIRGDGKGYYNPNASISRGDFTLMLCRAFELHADAKGSFTDVDEDSYYSDAVATAKALKIAKGQGGKFNPKSSLSRQDAMVLLVRAMEAAEIDLPSAEESVLDAFSDGGKISDYAVEAVAALTQAGIIRGSGGMLHPKSNVSRAEMAVILSRALDV